MHHKLAMPTPIGQYKKFNRIQHQFNTKTKQGLLYKSSCFNSKIWQVRVLSASEFAVLVSSNLELGKTEQLKWNS